MSNKGNENDGGNNSSPVPWGTKVGYIGTGVLIGLIIYPFVRKGLAKIQPKADEFLDRLTGKAEEMAEKASDLMAKAKQNLTSEKEDHGHDHQ